jgi:hypothetical protein
VLHERRGARVTDRALDLRPAELTILVPLVGLLLFLSAWPAAVTDRVAGKVLPSSARIELTEDGLRAWIPADGQPPSEARLEAVRSCLFDDGSEGINPIDEANLERCLGKAFWA